MANLIVRSVLITGSSRGIGLELVKAFLKKQSPPAHVFAACRNPDSAQELKFLSSKHSNLATIKLDITDQGTIEAAHSDITQRLNGRGLNLLINNAGIAVFHTLYEATAEDMMEMYKTNTIGPMLVTKAFHPLMKKAAKENPIEVKSCSKAAVINITSGAASIDSVKFEFLEHPLCEYRCSKAALNMLTRCQAETYKTDGIIAVTVAPGWVQTDMGGPKAPLKLHDSVDGMMKMFDTLTEKHNGLFLNWNGKTLPW